MGGRAPGRQLAALLLLWAVPGANSEQGLADGTALVQVREGSGSVAAHSEAAAEMINGMVSFFKGATGGNKRWGAPKEKSIMEGPSGCVWSRDLKASWSHMSQIMPTIEHAVLSIMMPQMLEMGRKMEAGEASMSKEEQKANSNAMMNQMMDAFAPLKDELMPPECDNALIKKKVMSQSMMGGSDAEDITVKCLVKFTHVTPACARCSGNFLKDFMGRGMMGLASSCVPKCMGANNACKKGLTESCITKSYPCMKCMKPGMMQFTDCIGLNTTQMGLSNKLDLAAKALRDGSVSTSEGVQSFVNDIVLAMNA